MDNAEDEEDHMSKATGEVVDITEEDDKAGAIAEAAKTIGEADELASDNHCKEDAGGSSTTTGSPRSEELDHAATEESAVNDKDDTESGEASAHEGNKVPAASSVINLGDYKSLSNTPLECYKLGTFVRDMIADRAGIERDYASKLYHWAALWRNLPMKQYSQGNSLRQALDAFLDEAIAVHILQTELSQCMANAGKQIVDWMKANLTWTVLGGCREKKDLERDFRRIQGFWQKLLGDVEKAKAAYHASLKKAQQDGKDSGHTSKYSDAKISTEIANYEEMYRNKIKDAQDAKEDYAQLVYSLNSRCARMEKNKELAIGRALNMIQDMLQVHQEQKLTVVCKAFNEAVKELDANQDLKQWEEEKGVYDEPEVPTFEAECSCQSLK